ncbi:MAG: hypothetical protein Q9226_001630 [Calogaya cf. arnoldii]
MTVAFANPFWARQDELPDDPAVAAAVSSASAAEDSASTLSTTPAAAESSTSATESAPPAEQTNANGTSAATSTSNDAAAATSSSSTSASSTPTPTVSCHKSSSTRPDDHIQNPFCEPKEGQILVVGQTYPLTWDPTLFKQESTNNIFLEIVRANDDGKNKTTVWKQEGVRNEEGKVTNFKVHQDTFENEKFGLKNATSLTLFIKSDPSDNPVWSGPTLTLVVDPKNANSTKSGKDSHIGEKAGIPVGLGVFLIAVAGLVFWFLRRRRNNSAGYLAKRKGASRMTGDESGGGGGFTDEPTRGMELQDRQGHGRQDSWEAGWDSTSSQGGGGNTFRDEIDRQRRR